MLDRETTGVATLDLAAQVEQPVRGRHRRELRLVLGQTLATNTKSVGGTRLELLGGVGVEGVRSRVVDHPVDSRAVPVLATADLLDGRGRRDDGGVDVTVEVDREPGVEVEAVEPVQALDQTAAGNRPAARRRQRDPAAGELGRVAHGQVVAREQRRDRDLRRRLGRGGQRRHGGQGERAKGDGAGNRKSPSGAS